jgi:hypothetical protein
MSCTLTTRPPRCILIAIQLLKLKIQQRRKTMLPDRERRINAVPAAPIPGDAVIVLRPYCGIKAGAVAILDGTIGVPQKEFLGVVPYSTFRGPSSKYSAETEFVSSSGGPCPVIAAEELAFSGHILPVLCWRWIDLPRVDSGEHYRIEVPLWLW